MTSCKGDTAAKPDKPKRAGRCFPAALLVSILLIIGARPGAGQPPAARQFEDLFQQAVDCLHRSETDKALRLGQQSLAAARAIGDKTKEARALDLIGNAYFYQDRYIEALDSFQASLLILRNSGDQQNLAMVLKDVGITYHRLGRFDEGFGPLYEALSLSRELNDNAAVQSALENLSMGYAAIGAYNSAFEMCEQALNVARQTQKPELIFGALIRIGILYHSFNSPEQALNYLQPALEIAQQQKLSPMNQAWAMQELSVALGELGQTEAAIEMRHSSLALCEKIRWRLGKAANFQGLGELYLDEDPTRALRYFVRAEAIFEESEFNLRSGNEASIAAAYRRLGNLDRAVEYYERAIERIEMLRGQLVLEQHRATMLGKHERVYQELMEVLMERHQRDPENRDDVRAFEVYEHGKARALVEAIAAARLDIERDLDPGLRWKQQELGTRIAEFEKRLSAPVNTEAERRQLRDGLSQAEQEFDQLVGEIKQHNPRYALLNYPRPLSLEQTQELLDPRTAMVAYSLTNDHVIGFLITAQSFRAEQLSVSPRVLSARVQNYVDLIARGDQSGWQEASARLYSELLAPLRGRLPGEIDHLIVIPDGVLHYLPFETLQVVGKNPQAINEAGSSPAARFLLQEFSISYAPSATVLAQLKAAEPSPAASARADLLIIADPPFETARQSQAGPRSAADYGRVLYEDEGLEVMPIPFTGAEARQVAQYGGPGSTVYTGWEASERRVKSEKLGTFRVVHFATHAVISQRRPERSALLLASSAGDGEDGFLQAREIYRLKLASELLVLSACDTARGQILAGEGVQGLARAFFYAGAQSVVASLWKVNDEETATFMGAFYQHLAEAKPKAEALRAAKLEIIQSGSTSPRRWASFVLIGEGARRLPIANRRPRYDRWLLPGAVAVLIGLSLLVICRRRTTSAGLRRSTFADSSNIP